MDHTPTETPTPCLCDDSQSHIIRRRIAHARCAIFAGCAVPHSGPIGRKRRAVQRARGVAQSVNEAVAPAFHTLRDASHNHTPMFEQREALKSEVTSATQSQSRPGNISSESSSSELSRCANSASKQPSSVLLEPNPSLASVSPAFPSEGSGITLWSTRAAMEGLLTARPWCCSY